jgi:hypothetical protein
MGSKMETWFDKRFEDFVGDKVEKNNGQPSGCIGCWHYCTLLNIGCTGKLDPKTCDSYCDFGHDPGDCLFVSPEDKQRTLARYVKLMAEA